MVVLLARDFEEIDTSGAREEGFNSILDGFLCWVGRIL